MRFAALECSLRTANTKVQDILVLNKAIKKLKKRAFKLKFPHVSQMNDITNLKMYAFSDAAVFNLPSKVASTRGHIILLVIDEKAYVISWGSKKIKRVVKQIINAECIALSLCIDEAMTLKECIIQILNLDKQHAKYAAHLCIYRL